MAKATIQQVLNCGFRAEQFGTPADFETATTGYLAQLIADASVMVAAAVGAAAYAAAVAPSIGELRLRNAELCACKAELWKRRAAFLDHNAMASLGEAVSREREAYLKHAAEAFDCYRFWVAEFTTDGQADQDAGSGVTTGYAETGPYATEAAA